MRTRTFKKNFWFSEEECYNLRIKSEKAGINESDYIRNIVMGNTLKEKPDEEFYKSIKMMRSVANNLNQIAKKAHSLGFIDELTYKREVEKVDKIIDEIKEKFLNNNICGDDK